MNKKAIIYLACSLAAMFCSAAVAVMILQDNYEVILNINWSALGLMTGIAAIILAINAVKENAPKWLCIVIMIVSLLSSGICLLNFMACVMCISMWFGLIF